MKALFSLNSKLFSQFTIPVLLAVLLLVTGCHTVPQESIASFAVAASAARSNSQEVFAAVDELISEASIDYAAAQPTLSEASFVAGLDQNGLELWDQALRSLESYGQHLAMLTSPELTKGFEEESVHLAGELKEFGDKLQKEGTLSQAPAFNPNLAAGFTELGSLLIRVKAQADARRVMQAAEPHIRNVLLQMASSIGSSPGDGVRGTVKSHWNNLLAQKKAEFLDKSAAEKRETAAAFQGLLGKRAAQDRALLSLQRSLLALADLHHFLAQGDALNARQALKVLSEEAGRTMQLKSQFEGQLTEPHSKTP